MKPTKILECNLAFGPSDKTKFLKIVLYGKGGFALEVAYYRKFQNYETVKGGCIPSKNKVKTQKNNKLRWLASDKFQTATRSCFD